MVAQRRTHRDMKPRLNLWKWASRRGILARVLGLAVATGPALGAEDSTVTNSAPNPSLVVYLEYQELGYSFMNSGLTFERQSGPFKKEPDLGGRHVYRGAIRFGTGFGSVERSRSAGAASPDTNHFIPFVWDYTQGKLYLDLNRNQDLTDDPEGVHGCAVKRFSRGFQMFTNVHLAFSTKAGTHRFLADLNLHNYGGNPPDGYALLRSFWQGKITLQDREWQLGWVQGLHDPIGAGKSGHLLLRPWEERNQPFSLQDGSLDGFGFNRKLFFQSQAYELDSVIEPQGNAVRFKVEFKEQQTKLGELKLTGQFIHRLILTDAPWTVVLDAPASVVKVPLGTCSHYQVQLKHGSKEAYRDVIDRSASISPIVISDSKTAVLTTGGPLTNSVAISRRGKYLDLSYQLLGADRAKYLRLGQDRTKPPTFAIYQGGRKIASGKFEFG